MKRIETFDLGIVVERRDSSHAWQDHSWSTVAVLPGAPPMNPRGEWRAMESGAGWTRWLAGTLTVELHRTETDGYRTNLSGMRPSVYVVLRAADESAHELVPFAATVSAHEAEAFLDGDDIVSGVIMPPEIMAFVQAFIDAHHVDRPFKKRQRKPNDDDGQPEYPLPPTVGRMGHGR